MTGVGAFMGTVKAASAQDQGGKAENVSKDYLMQGMTVFKECLGQP